MNKFLKIASSGVKNLSPYIPGKPIEELQREYNIPNIIKLASNENPYSPSPKVIDALNNFLLTPNEISRYPDGSGYTLKAAISKKLNLNTEQITLGNGSNDLLDMICRCFAEINDEIIFSEYAFAVYPICTQAVGATAVISKAKQWGHDLDEMLNLISNRTKIIFIANPNNPTGTFLSSDAIYSFLKKVPENVIVVLDEAYMEYVYNKNCPYFNQYTPANLWLNEFQNLIVTRTFSKAYGLANLRMGYSLSCEEISNILNRVRQPFNNNSLALRAAEAALLDNTYLNHTVDLNWQEMSFVESQLENMDIKYIPSAGNFLCVNVTEKIKSLTSMDIYENLLQKGIIVRPIANYNMPDYLRVTIGKNIENQKFISFIKSILL